MGVVGGVRTSGRRVGAGGRCARWAAAAGGRRKSERQAASSLLLILSLSSGALGKPSKEGGGSARRRSEARRIGGERRGEAAAGRQAALRRRLELPRDSPAGAVSGSGARAARRAYAGKWSVTATRPHAQVNLATSASSRASSAEAEDERVPRPPALRRPATAASAVRALVAPILAPPSTARPCAPRRSLLPPSLLRLYLHRWPPELLPATPGSSGATVNVEEVGHPSSLRLRPRPSASPPPLCPAWRCPPSTSVCAATPLSSPSPFWACSCSFSVASVCAGWPPLRACRGGGEIDG